MNVWNKVLMALVTIMCVVFGVLASNKYALTKQQEANLAKLESDLAKAQADVQQLQYEIFGSPEKAVKDWKELALTARLAYVRNLQNGESFGNCQPVEARIDEENASSTIAFGIDPSDKTTAFRTGAVAFVFDSGAQVVKKAAAGSADADSDADATDVAANDSAADSDDESAAAVAAAANPYVFLGAFKVTGASDVQVKLESIGNASADELAALKESARSGRSWVVYVDRLPMDSPADVAYFESEQPARASVLPADTASFVTMGFTPEDVDAIAEGSAIAAESRFPVDFQGLLENAWTTRDQENVLNARNTLALSTLTNIIADQFVAIGDKVVDEDVLAFQDWDDVYAAAVARKKVDSWRESIEKTEAALDRMNGYRDLVKKTLDAALEGVADCQAAIDLLIADNAKKAASIAYAQFLALEKIEAESKTVSNSEANTNEI